MKALNPGLNGMARRLRLLWGDLFSPDIEIDRALLKGWRQVILKAG